MRSILLRSSSIFNLEFTFHLKFVSIYWCSLIFQYPTYIVSFIPFLLTSVLDPYSFSCLLVGNLCHPLLIFYHSVIKILTPVVVIELLLTSSSLPSCRDWEKVKRLLKMTAWFQKNIIKFDSLFFFTKTVLDSTTAKLSDSTKT